MQETSETYKRILQGPHSFDTSVTIGDAGCLVDNSGDRILFGADSILVDSGGPESGFREDALFSVITKSPFFKDSTPSVGTAASGTVDIEMIAPYNIPRKGRICVYSRAVSDTEESEWVQQGVYYIDTRKQVHDERGFDVLTLSGYDAMMLAEVTFPSDNSHDYPILDTELVEFVAENMKIDSNGSGISVDPRTWDIMTSGYKFPLPVGYSMREVLRMIAAAYAGNFIIAPTGMLRLVSMFDLPPETRHLITDDGYKITFGGDYIRV